MKRELPTAGTRTEHQQVERARRRQVSGLHPAREAIARLGPQLDGLSQANVGRRLSVDDLARLESAGDESLMADRAVGERRDPRVILPVEACELVAVRGLEAAVLDLGRRPGIRERPRDS